MLLLVCARRSGSVERCKSTTEITLFPNDTGTKTNFIAVILKAHPANTAQSAAPTVWPIVTKTQKGAPPATNRLRASQTTIEYFPRRQLYVSRVTDEE